MSFETAPWNLTIRQVAPDTPSSNIAFAQTFTLYTDTTLTTPFPLSGYTGECVFGPPVNIELTTSGSQLVLDGAAGTVELLLTAEQVNAQSYLTQAGYYIQLTDAFGNVGIPINGVAYWAKAAPGGVL